MRFWLEYAGRRLPLDPGTYVVGRSTGAELVLDDALVSRRHAQFVVEEDAIRVEDLGSVNGLFVNGERVNGARKLVAGDCVVVGKQELVVGASMTTSDRPREVGRFTADTLVGLEPEPRADSDSESTHQGDALELLGGVADKVLALGRGDEAERILAAYLKNLMETVQRTRRRARGCRQSRGLCREAGGGHQEGRVDRLRLRDVHAPAPPVASARRGRVVHRAAPRARREPA